MEIELTKGFKTVIDDEDFDLVRGFRWTAHKSRNAFYAGAWVKQEVGKSKLVLMHRLILDTQQGRFVDHKDGDTLNNRRSNIRECSHAENMLNKKVYKSSKTGVRNVCLEMYGKDDFRYRATVRLNGVKHRKWCASLAEADSWANKVRLSLHGEFAYKKEQDARTM